MPAEPSFPCLAQELFAPRPSGGSGAPTVQHRDLIYEQAPEHQRMAMVEAPTRVDPHATLCEAVRTYIKATKGVDLDIGRAYLVVNCMAGDVFRATENGLVACGNVNAPIEKPAPVEDSSPGLLVVNDDHRDPWARASRYG